ncbi:rhodanese-like domain-containing protein [Paenibacillus sp. 19GGS1-52]|uniref:rhodanese-like domain-containing protein n=1 Tax=Paenibacillus sp. 19GGS1-52 TaxID=2758563 RepID=UPI001EFA6465|nr:rhodanese-like domain-containing protein [Paenibacillus sp. 19GGS1-52]ULO05654.1 rhodanese-like domain-containing protein [Paenibacillus sp. 19GGS1-52]
MPGRMNWCVTNALHDGSAVTGQLPVAAALLKGQGNMIILLCFLIGTVVLWFWRQFWPVRSLSYVNAQDWIQTKDSLNLKMLDVRDASDYLEEHISGSINISLGRLPYVWQHDLFPDNDVLILSNNLYQSNKAARILRKHGFRSLFAIQGDFLPDQTNFHEIPVKGGRNCEHRFNH